VFQCIFALAIKKGKLKLPECEVCIQGKLKTMFFENENKQRCLNLLKIIHSDVYGPMSTESLGRSKYMVSFIDDYS